MSKEMYTILESEEGSNWFAVPSDDSDVIELKAVSLGGAFKEAKKLVGKDSLNTKTYIDRNDQTQPVLFDN